MEIQFLEECELEIVQSFDEKSETLDCEDRIFNVGDVYDVDIVEEREQFVDIQFGNGGVAYNVNKQWYKELS